MGWHKGRAEEKSNSPFSLLGEGPGKKCVAVAALILKPSLPTLSQKEKGAN
jgi:hypothetical protein